MSEEPDVETIGTLLEDPTVRTILALTSQEPMSATTLTEHCSASKATVYRRLHDLRDHGLVAERTRPDVEDGHHRKVYRATLRRVIVTLSDGEFELEIRHEDMADRFTRLVEEM